MSLDGIAAARHYIDRIVHGDGKCSGMKVLLLDASTTQIVSSVYSQTEILNQEVYLVSRLDDSNSNQSSNSNGENGGLVHSTPTASNSHLKAVCFLRPTPPNVDLLARELAQPRFSEYHIFFSGILSSGLLRKLAENDARERVRQVQEFYADFLPINEDLLTIQCRHTLAMTVAAGTSWAPKYASQYERNLQGLQSMLLALKRQPSAIRYAGHSPCAEELANDLHDSIQADEIFHFRKSGRGGGLLLLVLDRRDDPVTPLLSQWTYQAMVHELLGLNNHRVILRGAPNVAKDLEEVVLSATQDDFFRKNRHKNFGELGEEIQRLLQDYQRQTAQHHSANLNTIEDMQNFMDKFPELRSRSHTVSKHVAIMGELARLVEVCSLMDVSQFEQELACADDHNTHWRELMEKLSSDSVKIPDKLRLGLLYSLRYEVSGNIHMVQSAMGKGGVPPDMVDLVKIMLRYGGVKSRGPGLYGDDHNLMSKMTKNFMTSVQGIQNVYSQHVPLVMDTIQSIMKGKLSARTHPVVPGSSNRPQPDQIIPDEILIYMVGGVTYEEGTKISEFNEANKGRVQVILGSSTVHNSTSFLDELKATSL
jgi:vacuolar protein sorting-associated protein 45